MAAPGDVKIKLQSTGVDARIEGDAERELESNDGNLNQKFAVEIEKAQPGMAYSIVVALSSGASMVLGTLMTDNEGKASISFGTQGHSDEDGGDNMGNLLPGGLTVGDIASVQITLNGQIVLTGVF